MSFDFVIKFGKSCNILRFTLILEFYPFVFILIFYINSLQIDELSECYFIDIEFKTFNYYI